jgi:hypothetical protein
VPSGLNILVVEIHGRNIKYYELITSHLVEGGVIKIFLSRQFSSTRWQNEREKRHRMALAASGEE